MTIISSTSAGHVYLVHADPDARFYLAEMLGQQGYATESFASLREFVSRSAFAAPAVLLLNAPFQTGAVSVLELFMKAGGRSMPIVVTGKLEEKQQLLDLFVNARPRFLAQPYLRESLLAQIQQLMGPDLSDPQNPNNRLHLRRLFEQLSPREKQVLLLLLRGWTAAEVAEMLGVGPGTVHSHRAAIYARFGDIRVKDFRKFFDLEDIMDWPDAELAQSLAMLKPASSRTR